MMLLFMSLFGHLWGLSQKQIIILIARLEQKIRHQSHYGSYHKPQQTRQLFSFVQWKKVNLKQLINLSNLSYCQ